MVEDDGSSANSNNKESYDSQQHDSDSYYNFDNESEINGSDEDSDVHSEDPDEVDDPVTQSRRLDMVNQRRLPGMVSSLAPKGRDDGLDGGYWTHTSPMLLAMMLAEQVGLHI